MPRTHSAPAGRLHPAHVAGGTTGGGQVAALCIVHDHAIGVEAPAKGANGALHALDPAARKAIAIALVEERDHFVAQDAIEVFRVALIVNAHIGVRAAVPDSEAIQAVVSLRPPAVENR